MQAISDMPHSVGEFCRIDDRLARRWISSAQNGTGIDIDVSIAKLAEAGGDEGIGSLQYVRLIDRVSET
jgi:hypothetical protein